MMNTNLVSQIGKIAANTWQRQFAEISLSAGAQPIALRDIPDHDFKRFANNQNHTVIQNGHICLELAEFVRICIATQPNVSRELAPNINATNLFQRAPKEACA